MATPGTSDHGWGLAIDAAVRDPRSGQAVGVYRSAAWAWLREHLTQYGLCWAWADEGDEPWHWHLFEIGAPAVLAHEAGSPPPISPPPEPPPPVVAVVTPAVPEFDPANRRYWLYPLNPDKDVLHVGSTGDTVRYLQGVCANEVSRFAAWFGAQEPEILPDGHRNPRKLYLRAAADECATMAVDGHYDESVARAISFVQHAFSDSNFDGRRIGRAGRRRLGRPAADVAVHRHARRRAVGGLTRTSRLGLRRIVAGRLARRDARSLDRRDGRSRPTIPAAIAGAAVGGGERVDRLVGVEPARVRHHPQLGAAERLGLPPEHGVAPTERVAVGRHPGDGDDPRAVLGDEPAQALAALAELDRGQLRRPRRRPGDEVGDADAPLDEVAPVVVGHPRPAVDDPIDHPAAQQRRVEAVAGVGEVGGRGRRPQPGVDADEQQAQAGPDQIRHGRRRGTPPARPD